MLMRVLLFNTARDVKKIKIKSLSRGIKPITKYISILNMKMKVTVPDWVLTFSLFCTI